MIKSNIIFWIILFGLSSCNKDNSSEVKWQGWWKTQENPENINLNTLEWNISKSQILHFKSDLIEFIDGLQYFPTRHYGFFTPYKLHEDTISIYYEPEGKFIDFRVNKESRDSISISRGPVNIYLQRMNDVVNYNTFSIEDILSVDLYVEYDSMSNQSDLKNFEILVKVPNKVVEFNNENNVIVNKQITPFEIAYLVKQINRIDLSKKKYKTVVSDAAIYTLRIRTLNQEINLELGDNTTTPLFMKGLIKNLQYMGRID